MTYKKVNVYGRWILGWEAFRRLIRLHVGRFDRCDAGKALSSLLISESGILQFLTAGLGRKSARTSGQWSEDSTSKPPENIHPRILSMSTPKRRRGHSLHLELSDRLYTDSPPVAAVFLVLFDARTG